MTDEALGRQHLVFERMIRALIDCPLPIVRTVSGAAYARGSARFLHAAKERDEGTLEWSRNKPVEELPEE